MRNEIERLKGSGWIQGQITTDIIYISTGSYSSGISVFFVGSIVE
jgi:hypothetical protein